MLKLRQYNNGQGHYKEQLDAQPEILEKSAHRVLRGNIMESELLRLHTATSDLRKIGRAKILRTGMNHGM